MSAAEDVTLRLRLLDSLRFRAEAQRAARSIHEIGDEARKASRSTAGLNLGFLSVRANARQLALPIGSAGVATERFAGLVGGTAPQVAALAGGTAAAAAVMGTSLVQGAGVGALALGGLSEALGGNQKAL